MKKLFRILAVFLSALLLAAPAAADEPDIASLREDILTGQTELAGVSSVQSWINDVLAAQPGTGEEWYVIALRQSGAGYDYTAYREALEKKVSEEKIASASSRERIALTLLALEGGEDYIAEVMDSSIGELGLMSWVYGLHLFRNGAQSTKVTEEEVISHLLQEQKPDGGWCIIGDYGDVDVTAMTISALSGYMEREDVSAAVEKAVAFLSERQHDNGGYASVGEENPESACQVLCACANIGIDALKDERFIKNGQTILDFIKGFKTDDHGMYAHFADGDANAVATIQVFYSLTAYTRFLEGKGPLFIFDEPLPEPDPALQPAAKGPGAKTVLYIVIAAALAAAIILNLVKKKKNYKNYLFPVIVAVLAVLAVTFIKIEKTSDYYGSKTGAGDHPIATTITIRCDTVAGRADHIPADGVILAETEIILDEGSTAYDQLVAAVKEYSIQMDNNGSSRQAYIAGINYLYEFDYGELSGWMFAVNGEFASVGCGEYKLKEGDRVEWLYTTNLGKDLGVEEF